MDESPHRNLPANSYPDTFKTISDRRRPFYDRYDAQDGYYALECAWLPARDSGSHAHDACFEQDGGYGAGLERKQGCNLIRWPLWLKQCTSS